LFLLWFPSGAAACSQAERIAPRL